MRFGVEQRAANGPRRPVAAQLAVGDPCAHDAAVGMMPLRQRDDGGEIALEIAAGDAETGRQIGLRSNARIELQRRHDFRPVRADVLADFRQGVGDADRGDETAIDRNLRQLRALVAHRQDWAAESREDGEISRLDRCGRIGAADDGSLGMQRALHRAAEHQRLHLIV